MTRLQRRLSFFVACLSIVLAPRFARAAIDNWNVATSGVFGNAANWTPALPGAADTALFNVNSQYTVTFTTSIQNTAFEVDNGLVTFGLGGNTYTASNTGIVGNIAGQTGQLSIINGKIIGGLSVGNISGATGFLTLSNFSSWNTGNSAPTIGASGAGTMTITSGGQLSTTANVILGASATGDGTLVVTGADSALNSASLLIGNSGSGAVTVSAGGSVKTTQGVTLASTTGTTGSLTITGTSSILDASTQTMVVGNLGAGHLFVTNGGTLNTGAATLANGSNSSGDATVDGADSTWNIGGQFLVGNTGPGVVNITNGGSLNTSGPLQTTIGVSGSGTIALSGAGSSWLAKTNVVVSTTGTLTVGSGALMTLPTTNLTMNSSTSTLNVNGGTIDVGGSFSRLGNFNFNDGTILVRGAYSNGSASAPLIIDGTLTTALPTLELLGNFSTSNIGQIFVGNLRQGALVIGDGRNVNVGVNSISIGALGGSKGALTLTGDSALLTTTGTTAVGGAGSIPGGTGLLTVANGATLTTGALSVFGGGTVVVNGGGTINFGNLGVANGAFDFNSGTVNFTGASFSLSSSQLDLFVGAADSVGSGRTISSSNALTIGAPVTISGGSISAGTTLTVGAAVQINDGTLSAATTLTNNAGQVVQISSTGLLSAGGITNNGTIQLNGNVAATTGGTLTNSGIIRGAGFVGNNLTNNAAGQVQVTTGNRLEFDGSANTNSGLLSMTGGELVFTGPLTNSASTGLVTGHDAILRTGGITNNGGIGFTAGTMDIYGDITNNVGGQITCSGGGTTTFYDDVTIASGATSVKATAVGSTVSKVVFFGSYNGGIVGGGTAFIEGDLRPGNSPGVVSFGGDLVLDGGSQTFIDIGGTTAGNGAGHYDQVNVAGNVSISGGLTLSPFNGFVPSSGDKFVIMTYASETGTFNPVSGTTPAPGLTLVPIYLPNSLVVLTVVNGEKTWGVDSDGNLSIGSNWIGGAAPGGMGDSGTFSTIITAPRVVTVDADTTLGNLKFDSPISYTIAGPHKLTLQASGSAAATITDSNAHGNGAHTISAPVALASDLNVVQNSSGALRLSGTLDDSSAHAITKSGAGTAEIAGPPNFGANTPIAVNGGTLRFVLTSGSPTVAGGVTVTVNDSATLELAGSVSALSAGANRASVINNSTGGGILVSGTNQVVGTIDGGGATVVNSGSNLTANHIVEGALIIGGTVGSPALVTIAASDASGNSLAVVTSGASLAGNSDWPAQAPSLANLAGDAGLKPASAGSVADSAALLLPPPLAADVAAVPEPSTIVLLMLGIAVTLASFCRRWPR